MLWNQACFSLTRQQKHNLALRKLQEKFYWTHPHPWHLLISFDRLVRWKRETLKSTAAPPTQWLSTAIPSAPRQTIFSFAMTTSRTQHHLVFSSSKADCGRSLLINQVTPFSPTWTSFMQKTFHWWHHDDNAQHTDNMLQQEALALFSGLIFCITSDLSTWWQQTTTNN